MSDWRNQPASEKQIAYLTSQGIGVEHGLTKGRASVLIAGEPTEGQLRRLSFYGIPAGPHLTKENASDLIDDYARDHPESEALYQAWKKSGNISAAGGGYYLGAAAIVCGVLFLSTFSRCATNKANEDARFRAGLEAENLAKRLKSVNDDRKPITPERRRATPPEENIDARVARDRKIEEDRVDAEKAAIASKEAWARINKSEADKKAEVYRKDIDKETFTKASSARALVKFPALGTANSSFNIQFVIRHKRYKDENPAFFNDPDWPMILARECDEFLKRR